MTRIGPILRTLTRSPDLVIAAVLLLTVMLMILPMPTLLVDALIGFNLGVAVLLMMTAVYLASPLSLSSLPGLILISTIFRLAMSITTTRLILAEGDAGKIVETFGTFVIAGNVVVGIVVFLIITVVHFIVIAKGSERIAEVAARFTLDAMPGKQMSIDAELRNGDIDNETAGRKRSELQRESQFYGAMDGTMKFVKGDAIAGLVIIVVNLVGGITIGMAQRGMALSEAMYKYSLLTVGDALISQIPALLLAITAATVVTRVPGSERQNLGRDIFDQLSSDIRAMRLAAGVVGGMALLPGFPTLVLLTLAGLFLGASVLSARRRDRNAAADADATEPEGTAAGGGAAPAADEGTGPEPIMLLLSEGLAAAFPPGTIAAGLAAVGRRVAADRGAPVPGLGYQIDRSLPEGTFRVAFDGVPIHEDTCPPGELLILDDRRALDLALIPWEVREGAVTVSSDHAPALREAGIAYRAAPESALAAVERLLVGRIWEFFGIQEAASVLSADEQKYAALIGEVLKGTPIHRIAEVMKRLLEEGVPIRNLRVILECLAEYGEREPDSGRLTEYLRSALKRQISHAAAVDGRIAAIVLHDDTEAAIRDHVRDAGGGLYFVPDSAFAARLLGPLRGLLGEAGLSERPPVLICATDIRRHLRSFLARQGIDATVLSYQEISDSVMVVTVATLVLAPDERDAAALRAAAPSPDEFAAAEG